jgi:integral membrane protein
MAAMMSILSGQGNGAKVAGWFRLVALAEAFSWVGLLVGMYFKYLGTPATEIGVKIFGPLHGGIFMAFVVMALLAGIVFKWSALTWFLALLGSIVPLASVIFVMWADRTGRLGARTPGVDDAVATAQTATDAA